MHSLNTPSNLTHLALLRLADILCPRPKYSKVLYPAPLCPSISDTPLPDNSETRHDLAGRPHHRLPIRCHLAVHASLIALGPFHRQETMHQPLSINLHRRRIIHLRRHCYHASAYLRA
jgi:hypothetical protein